MKCTVRAQSSQNTYLILPTEPNNLFQRSNATVDRADLSSLVLFLSRLAFSLDLKIFR